MPIPHDIRDYNAAQAAGHRRVCQALAKAIASAFEENNLAESKIWHRHPVWFLDGNPIVGYSKIADGIRLMFWSGQSFEEPGLLPEPPDTKFKSAGIRYSEVDEINLKDLQRWLRKSHTIQWDYKNIVKRKGRLERLK